MSARRYKIVLTFAADKKIAPKALMAVEGDCLAQLERLTEDFGIVYSDDTVESGETDAAAAPAGKKKTYEVDYLLHYNGTRKIEAASEEEAMRLVDEWLTEDPADALQSAELAMAEAIEVKG